MARYRKIDPRIWNDAKFSELSDNGKLVFFMLLTHPNMTSLGAMRGTIEGLAAEMHWTTEAFREAFREALSKGMAEHDAKACFVSLPSFIKYNQPESPNVVKAWVGALDLLPECDLKNRVVARARDFAEAMPKGFGKAFAEAFAKNMPNQEQEPEQKNKSAAEPPFDFKADLFARWKALPNAGGGAFLNKLFRDHKPEDRVMDAVERTLAETRADPKAFVLGILKAPPAEKRIDGETLDEALARAI